MIKIEQVDQANIVAKMLENRDNWEAVENFAEEVMKNKEDAERMRQGIVERF
jgi:L-fucose isomerase-like protein